MYAKHEEVSVPRYLTTIRMLCQNSSQSRGKVERKGPRKTSRKKEHQCRITQTVYNIAVSTPYRHSVQSDTPQTAYNKYFKSGPSPAAKSNLWPISTEYSHSPSISFHHQQNRKESPKYLLIPKKENTTNRCQTVSTLSERPHPDTERSNSAPFGQVFLANNDQTEIDPEIVEDLMRLANNS